MSLLTIGHQGKLAIVTVDHPPDTRSEEEWRELEADIAKRAKGETAPLKALACLRKTTETDFATAMNFERRTFLELRASDQAAALRAVFFAKRAALRPARYKDVQPKTLQSVAVIGGGTMGAGIAVALRDAGLPVTLVERDDEALAHGMAKVQNIFVGGGQTG